MSQIHDIREPFAFDQLRLSTPFTRNGGYFMKFSVADGPLYLQPPKSTLKTGFVKSGKKILCDLIFSNENDQFLAWLEKLEEYAQETIYDNRAKWFETELDKHDIESCITSPYKMYKSGKFYIIRTNAPIALGKCDLKVYDENELEVNHDDIKENTNVMVILEFKGIKCSSRSFQFEIELKQMLVMKPDLLFEKCILNHRNAGSVATEQTPSVKEASVVPSKYPALERVVPPPPTKHSSSDLAAKTPSPTPTPMSTPTPATAPARAPATPTTTLLPLALPSPPVVLESAPEPVKEEICEVDFDLVEVTAKEPVQLKNRNEVYYKMYKEAKRVAREAKMIALSNYLEAKRIKMTYLLDDVEDSEEDEETVQSWNQSLDDLKRSSS